MLLISVALGMLCSCGGERSVTCEVTQYGPKYMTYGGPSESFNEACREALHSLSQKETVDGTSIRYSHYGEGVSFHKAADRQVAVEGYMKTLDADGAAHKITTLLLGKQDPVVILESTASDSYKLVNALNSELNKRGIKVSQYLQTKASSRACWQKKQTLPNSMRLSVRRSAH